MQFIQLMEMVLTLKNFYVLPQQARVSYKVVLFALAVIIDCLAVHYPSSILVNASQSGIYIDNGHDQTIMHRALDEEEKMAASYDILEFLGLPERPHRKHSHLSLR